MAPPPSGEILDSIIERSYKHRPDLTKTEKIIDFFDRAIRCADRIIESVESGEEEEDESAGFTLAGLKHDRPSLVDAYNLYSPVPWADK